MSCEQEQEQEQEYVERVRVPRFVGVLLVLALAPSLTACTTEVVCVLWVDFESPAAAAADSDLVVTGRVIGTEGTARLFAVDAAVHRVEVDRVMKGELDERELLVASSPLTCMGGNDLYSEGDPLETSGQVQLFLKNDKGVWRTITPMDGVVPIPAGGTLPWDGSEPDE